MRRALLLLALILAGCNDPAADTEQSRTVTGVVTIKDDIRDTFHDTASDWAKQVERDDEYVCQGDGGHSDLRPGAPVTVRDGTGNIVGTSHLRLGRYLIYDTTGQLVSFDDFHMDNGFPDVHNRKLFAEPSGDDVAGDELFSGVCELPFAVILPADAADFYQVEVAGRGQVAFSNEDLEMQGWSVELEIGG
jgi:hypothetical protein